jgi:hypothetical protein
MTTTAPSISVALTANELRALAEEADGNRGKNLKLVASNTPGRPARFVPESDSGDAVMIVVKTDDVEPKKAKLEVVLPKVVFVDPEGRVVKPIKSGATGEEDNYFEAFDALFWSAPAVDKFLVRYYASFMELDHIKSDIQKAFANPNVLAIAHLPKSEPADGTGKTRHARLGLMLLTWEPKEQQIVASPLL